MIKELRSSFGGVYIRKLTEADNLSETNSAFVDIAQLTDRQHETLETAYQMGYFDYPKGSNATEVAEALEISPSTLSELLFAAQRKIFEAILGP